MEADRIKWNSRFASQDSYLGERPSPFLLREIDNIKSTLTGRDALDIACGEGRNSLFLAQNGFKVVGLDISDIGLEKGRNRAQAIGVDIDFRMVDLDDCIIDGAFDLILNFNFLLRNLIAPAVAALKPGGILLFDTIMASEQLLKDHCPAYLLQPGELYNLFSPFNGSIHLSEESCDGEMPTARLLFRKDQ